eukprot:2409722-Amphidinium_carterae.1
MLHALQDAPMQLVGVAREGDKWKFKVNDDAAKILDMGCKGSKPCLNSPMHVLSELQGCIINYPQKTSELRHEIVSAILFHFGLLFRCLRGWAPS